MNYWIKRNHKRQNDILVNYLMSYTTISIGLNFYSRSNHSIEVICNRGYFLLFERINNGILDLLAILPF